MTNLCESCPVLDVAPCPLLDRAYDRGYDGMGVCEMNGVIVKLVKQVKERAALGPKEKPE